MKSLPERLNDRLDKQQRTFVRPGEVHTDKLSLPTDQDDREIDELIALARRFQCASSLQVDNAFANWLERRMLRHHLEVQQKKQTTRSWWFLRPYRAHPAVAAICSLCVVLLLLGTSALAMAARTTNPSSPFYALKQLEQHLQYSFASSPADQVTLDMEFTRDRLNALFSVADQDHASDYMEALLDLNEQFTITATAINGLPISTQRSQLAGELSALESRARHELRGFLPTLNIVERLATTDELAHLGDSVPQLINAILTLPAHPGASTTISISGRGIQPRAQLLVNGSRFQVIGLSQGNQFVFTTTSWNGDQHPHSLGILNPDGTAAQTVDITTIAPRQNGNDNGNDNGDGSGHGHGGGSGSSGSSGGKPKATPTPHR